MKLVLSFYGKEKMFCYSPWIYLQVLQNGQLSPCCFANPGLVYDQNQKEITLADFPKTEEILNSKTYKDLRKSMMNNEFPAACGFCQTIEISNGQSPRKALLDGLTKYIDQNELLLNTQPDGELRNPKVKYLELKLDNICNLKCRICGPHYSSSWQFDASQILANGFNIENNQKFSTEKNHSTQLSNSKQFIDWVNSKSDSLLNLQITGGEPFLSPNNEIIIDQLIEKGYSSRINLIFTSNGTIFPFQLLRKFKMFKGVNIFLSIDGINKRFEYQRWPAKWTEVNENVLRWAAEIGNSVAKVTLQPTISIYNIACIHELLEWYIEKPATLEWPKHLNYVASPSYLSPTIINEFHKKKIQTNIQNLRMIYLNYQHPQQNRIVSWIDSIENLLNSNNDASKFDEFIKFNSMLDKIRKISYTDYLDPLTCNIIG